ncbi:hypothetical protein ACOSQ4_004138 [Xanthoceras sorbifolium]
MCLLVLLFQLMMILLSSPINVLVESELTRAKPGCPTSCGQVAIPFPLGIGSNCSLDHWYAVNCNSNKPFLRSINLEVLDISIEKGTMLVNHPVFTTCSKSYEDGDIYMASVNMETAPFSSLEREHILWRCDNLADVLYDETFIAVCYSSCPPSGAIDTGETIGFYGIICCQTRIPSSLQVFNVSVRPINLNKASKKDYKRAILVQQSWLTEHMENHIENGYGFLSHAKRVPVVLDWGIRNDSSFNWNTIDRHHSDCANISSSVGIQVHQYIDECKDKKNNDCGPYMICGNLIGNYKCYPPGKIIIIILGTCLFFSTFRDINGAIPRRCKQSQS